MGLPSVVMDGATRVSMCGYTMREEIDRFVAGFLQETDRQYKVSRKK
jgi:selenocysteine lyase/cysteine desulfurase